jgi:hypothetical protein
VESDPIPNPLDYESKKKHVVIQERETFWSKTLSVIRLVLVLWIVLWIFGLGVDIVMPHGVQGGGRVAPWTTAERIRFVTSDILLIVLGMAFLLLTYRRWR